MNLDLSIVTLQTLLNAKIVDKANLPESFRIKNLVIDTRVPSISENSVFIALIGDKEDGHQYISDFNIKGGKVVIVKKEIDSTEICQIIVENPLEALQKIAQHHRAQFKFPVIGITGSAGKTTTKEFTASACSSLGEVLKTIGNRNSEFTGPLLWPELTTETKVVITEMGMRGFGQIAHLAAFNKPTIGVITNIGYSHVELVGTREGIAKAKGEMLAELPEDGVAVLFSEDEYLGNLIAIATALLVA